MKGPKLRRIRFAFNEEELVSAEKLNEQGRMTAPQYCGPARDVDQADKNQQALAALEEFWEKGTALTAEEAERMEKETDLSRGHGYAELREAAWAVVYGWQHPAQVSLAGVNDRIVALAALLRDIAPWEEPPDA